MLLNQSQPDQLRLNQTEPGGRGSVDVPAPPGCPPVVGCTGPCVMLYTYCIAICHKLTQRHSEKLDGELRT